MQYLLTLEEHEALKKAGAGRVALAEKKTSDLSALAVLYLPKLTQVGHERLFLKDGMLPTPTDLESGEDAHPHGCIHIKGHNIHG